MTSTQRFAVWLKGFLDACDNNPTEKQVAKIKDVLNSIFEHVAESPKKPYDIYSEAKEIGGKIYNNKGEHVATERC